MRIVEESWNVLVTLLPTGWQQMAWRSGAVQRLRGFPSPDVLLRVLMLHVARCGAGGVIKSASQLCRFLMHVGPVVFPTSVHSQDP